MKEAPNLNTCTAEEFADWYIKEVKQTGSALLLPTGFYNYDVVNKIADAFRIVGQREGYKRGKRDGSYAGYKVGYGKGFDDGYSSCQQEAYENYIETGWL